MDEQCVIAYTYGMQQRGFTITELTAVIIVIGILITLGAVAASQVQKDTRDSKRESDIAILQNELEKYFETNGVYPPGCSNNCATWFVTDNTATGGTYINGTITQSTLKNILPGMLVNNFSDPNNSAPNTPFASSATYSGASQRYFYYGGAINVRTTSSGATNSTPTVDGNACIIHQALNPNEVGAYVVGYYSEGLKKWILKSGSNGRKQTVYTGSHASCAL